MALIFGFDVCASILFLNCKEIANRSQKALFAQQNTLLATVLIKGLTN
jgi:hypothetical protein